MEREVFSQSDIKQLMNQFILVKADITSNSEDNKELLNYFKLFGPPSILFFSSKGNEIINQRILGEIDSKNFKIKLYDALNRNTIQPIPYKS
jgi:thiol:disulfide interchange protein DsbD